jgi:uncharacterized membrane protein (DUF4010 family)
MDSLPRVSPEIFILVLGLSLFFGLAYEEFYSDSEVKRPGGARTFPLLALTGLVLFSIEPRGGVPFAAGLIILGLWMFKFYSFELDRKSEESRKDASIVTPVCVLVAYLMGPATLTQPLWFAVGITVAAVLLLTLREPLHAIARKLEPHEFRTAAQFLILTGIVLPLLPNNPVSDLTPITPYQAWLALVAVSTLSYAGYLLHRFVARTDSDIISALLGGLYSSTVTTIVLARRMRDGISSRNHAMTGIALTTAVMYLRLEAIVALFNIPLATVLFLPILCLAIGGGILAAVFARRLPNGGSGAADATTETPQNPLELRTAAIFALLFVLISVVMQWARQRYGDTGLFTLAAILGVTDIDPIVLNIAQGGTGVASEATMASAVLAAAASNNFLKALYTIVFGGWAKGRWGAVGLLILAAGTAATAYLLVR